MKKKIILISLLLIGFVLAVTANSWAQRERGRGHHGGRGGHFQEWDKPENHKFDRGNGRSYSPRRYHNPQGPVHRFKPKFHKRHRYGGPHRNWRHRPYYRHGHPRWHRWRHHRSHHSRPLIHNYYSSEDEFHASASVSDSGFSVSVGVSKTN